MSSIPAPVRLCQLPTPCHRLDRVSEDLGLDLWIKRDDLTGFAMGGNKGRKIEYLIAEAVASGADTVVTCGAAQSNFIRQLGAACAIFGIRCVAAVMNLPFAAVHGRPAQAGADLIPAGNMVLDRILGVELNEFPDDDWEVLYAHAEELAASAESSGAKVYQVPIGGSSPLGAYAFALAIEELEQPFDTIVCPSSSGSTHSGLAWACQPSPEGGFDVVVPEILPRVVGVACDPEPEIMEDLVRLVEGLDQLTGIHKRMTESDLELRLEWAGEAYGIPSPEGSAAIEYLARREGIFLDPVYSGKAFAGLLGLAHGQELSGRVLFWHTGGTPALFA